ncbi:MAG: acyl-phosphate glycerol 3-phosphate acyltransferase [Clostridiales bacterium 41_12_two_minus]|nr:MAG: acyl-phosphate glycerol 3-phosphate acyltransferase [Clostridiales bacterium 41_12_two_minus]
MTVALKLILIAVISYLLGSLNFGVLLSRKFENEDVRSKGSGNAGTTNMLRNYGKGMAVLTIVGDMAKVMVAILIAKLIISEGELSTYSIFADNTNIIIKSFAGLFAVLGHIFPCYFNFKGGKGVATSGGMVFMIDWRIALILLTMFILVVLITKYVSLGSLVMAFFYPVFIFAFYKSALLTVIALVFAIIVFIAHRENIKKLINKTESKISSKKK